jgi:hypothetical protein
MALGTFYLLSLTSLSRFAVRVKAESHAAFLYHYGAGGKLNEECKTNYLSLSWR